MVPLIGIVPENRDLGNRKSNVPAGIEPATTGLGNLTKGLSKGSEIPNKTLPAKYLSHIFILI